jgi:hypothetical protein
VIEAGYSTETTMEERKGGSTLDNGEAAE